MLLLLFLLLLEFMDFFDLSWIFLGCRIMDDMTEKDDNLYFVHFSPQLSKALQNISYQL